MDGDPVRLEFRDGNCAVSHSPSQLALLIYSVYATETLLGPEEVVNAVQELGRISSYVLDRLTSEYPSSDIVRGALGGIPSPKEVLLYLLARRVRPRWAIETGVAQGVSSVFLLEAIDRNGAGGLTSIDLPNYNPEGTSYRTEPTTHDGTYVKRELEVGWLVPPRLRSHWKLLLGASRDVLPAIPLVDLDLFYHDSEHSYANMMFEYEWALTRLPSGGVIASDDINWNRAFRDFVARHRRALKVLSDRRFGLALAMTPNDDSLRGRGVASSSHP
jgi:predicted O-methyltransferase YrrM